MDQINTNLKFYTVIETSDIPKLMTHNGVPDSKRSEKILFNLKQLTESSIKGNSITIISEFKDELYNLKENANNLYNNVEDLKTKIDMMLKAYERATSLDKKLHHSLLNNRNKILDLQKKFGGSQVRKEIGEENAKRTQLK